MTGAPGVDVSVIIAAWTAADFVGEAVRSALGQDGVSVEVVVVDDASPDDTLAAAEAAGAGDPRLICERLEVNSGPSGARNRALSLAGGRYFAVQDSDDAMAPGRLARLLAEARAKKADIVLDNLERVAPGEAGGPAFLQGPRARYAQSITLRDYMDPRTTQEFGGELGFLKPLVSMDALRASGLRYDPALRNSEDYFFIAGLLASGARMRYRPEPGYRYTVREGSLSHRLTPALIGAIVQADAAFQARYSAGFSEDERAAAARRRAALQRSEAFERVLHALKAGAPGRAAAELASRAGAAPHVARRFAQIAAAKAFGGVDPASR